MARKQKPPVAKTYDATKEFQPFGREKTDYHGHPRRRYGATQAKRMGITKRELHAKGLYHRPRSIVAVAPIVED